MVPVIAMRVYIYTRIECREPRVLLKRKRREIFGTCGHRMPPRREVAVYLDGV